MGGALATAPCAFWGSGIRATGSLPGPPGEVVAGLGDNLPAGVLWTSQPDRSAGLGPKGGKARGEGEVVAKPHQPSHCLCFEKPPTHDPLRVNPQPCPPTFNQLESLVSIFFF